MARLRGQDVRILLYLEGDTIKTVRPNSFDAKQILEVDKVERLGSRFVTYDSAGCEGYEGSIEFEMESFDLEDLEDKMLDAHRNAEEMPRIDITATFTLASGESRTYIYERVILEPSFNAASRSDPVKKSYSWKAVTRRRIA